MSVSSMVNYCTNNKLLDIYNENTINLKNNLYIYIYIIRCQEDIKIFLEL